MNSRVKLYNTVVKDGVFKYIIVKDGVFFGLDIVQVEELRTLCESILCERDAGTDSD